MIPNEIIKSLTEVRENWLVLNERNQANALLESIEEIKDGKGVSDKLQKEQQELVNKKSENLSKKQREATKKDREMKKQQNKQQNLLKKRPSIDMISKEEKQSDDLTKQGEKSEWRAKKERN